MNKALILASIACAAVGIGVGVLIGYFSRGSGNSPVLEKLVREEDPSVSQHLIEGINADNIREHLKYLTAVPHIAGKERERELARDLRDLWQAQLDSAKLYTYEVLLSFPQEDNPNKVQILDENDEEKFVNNPEEEILSPDQNHTDVVPPFNAYSPAGEATGDLIYVNYGRAEDFEKLEELGLDVNGKIVIARYGKIFRGNKITEAEARGAIGLILYSDPEDYTTGDVDSVFPDSWWLPGTGVQRGNVVLVKGDQLTQGYPSTPYAYRLTDAALTEQLPKIPCLPIGYDDAKEFLRRLGGPEAPEDWQGRLDIEYHLGPGFEAPEHTWKVRLESHNENVKRIIDNVIGRIDGEVEPDRYVLIGSHRDAWVFGSVDPSSSEATLREVARVFSEELKTGWRPRRTILFCSWGAEEYGLIGSTEYVEEMNKVLSGRAVAYHNMDSAAAGNFTLLGAATPSLRNVLKKATQKVPDPDNPSKTLYDTWKVRDPDEEADEPRIGIPGSGSDFAPFLQALGIPVTYHKYYYDRSMGIASHPLYHTVYETFSLMKFIDPDYKFCKAVGQVAIEMVRHLADSYILPLDASDYASVLQYYGDDVKDKHGEKLDAQGISLDGFQSAIENFTTAALQFHNRLDNVDKNNPIEVRRVNDQLLYLERAFTDAGGLPDRPLYRHIVFSPSSKDHYSGAAFSGLADLLYDIDSEPDQETEWERVKQHLAVIVYVIQSATHALASD